MGQKSSRTQESRLRPPPHVIPHFLPLPAHIPPAPGLGLKFLDPIAVEQSERRRNRKAWRKCAGNVCVKKERFTQQIPFHVRQLQPTVVLSLSRSFPTVLPGTLWAASWSSATSCCPAATLHLAAHRTNITSPRVQLRHFVQRFAWTGDVSKQASSSLH